jgi:hypothetical protein
MNDGAVARSRAAQLAEDRVEKEWTAIVELAEEALALARRRKRGGRVAVLFQEALWKAHRLHASPKRPLDAAGFRRGGWSYEDIAAKLDMTPERARKDVKEKTLSAYVVAMATTSDAPLKDWPLERLKLQQSIVFALRDYAIVTLGQLMLVDREALDVMEGLSDRDVRVVSKMIRQVEGNTKQRPARSRKQEA